MSLNNTLSFDELTLRNFFSYGNNDTVINLDNPGTTLIVGEDKDSGVGISNGAGKTTLLNGIVYALFDRPLAKDVKLDEMINNVNKKNMHVGLKFHKGTNYYEIIRQRKGKDGNTVKLFINGELKTLDSIDQTNKFIIEKIIGYSYEVFVRIVVFSANHEPFFSLPTSGSSKTTQTDIIEELFSLTVLTDKAVQAKAEIKENEQKVTLIQTKLELVEKERARHATQLTSVKQRLDAWDVAYDAKVEKAQDIIDSLGDMDFEAEVAAWASMTEIKSKVGQINQVYTRLVDWQETHNAKIVAVHRDRNPLLDVDFDTEIRLHNERKDLLAQEDDLNSSLIRSRTWDLQQTEKLEGLNVEFAELSKIDFDEQFRLFANIESLNHAINDTKAKLHFASRKQDDLQAVIDKNHAELVSLANAKCPYCEQEFHAAEEKKAELNATVMTAAKDIGEVIIEVTLATSKLEEYKNELEVSEAALTVKHISDLNRKATAFETVKSRIQDAESDTNPHVAALLELLDYPQLVNPIEEATKRVAELSEKIGKIQTTTPDARIATRMQSELVSLTKRLAELQAEINPNQVELGTLVGVVVDADNAFDVVNPLLTKLEGELKELADKVVTSDFKTAMRAEQEYQNAKERLDELKDDSNPFTSTYEELMAVELEDMDYEEINKLKKTIDHQKLLVKLLTKSDSFIRKALIDKNIPLLNDQLRIYLKELGLPHKVEFTNTMTASITQMGRPLSYNNLSTGQKARVNLALSWAFRDVLQKMHSPVNFCLLDEVLDVGLCANGIAAAAKMLKSKAKADKLTMFVISHRDELNSTFDRNLKVVFQRGFSKIEE